MAAGVCESFCSFLEAEVISTFIRSSRLFSVRSVFRPWVAASVCKTNKRRTVKSRLSAKLHSCFDFTLQPRREMCPFSLIGSSPTRLHSRLVPQPTFLLTHRSRQGNHCEIIGSGRNPRTAFSFLFSLV